MASFDTNTTQFIPALAWRVARAVFLAVDAVGEWNDARLTRKSLSRLTMEELDDIGLCRSDIDAISRRSARR